MAKRRLTRHQQWRIEKIQQERTKRADRKDIKLQEELEGGEFGADQVGRIIAHFGIQAEVEDSQGQVVRCHFRANLPALVTGDWVIWRAGNQQSGVITALEPRNSVICRPDAVGRLRPIAANVDLLLIVFAPEPTPYANLIDRYLIAAEEACIKPVLLLNKADLLNPHYQLIVEPLLKVYRSLQYEVLTVSTQQPESLEILRQLLSQHTSVFVGQSGVGKSSVVNALLPLENIKTSALSPLTQKGVHTTTTARLFHLPRGGTLIDSPGIREFGLGHISRETIEAGFIEFRPYLGHCKFRNCTHQHETSCALLMAVERGDIATERMKSYRHIVMSVEKEN